MTVTHKSTSNWPQSPHEQSEGALELWGEPEGRVQIRPWNQGWFICFGIFSKADIKQSKTFFEGHINVAAQRAIGVLSPIMHAEQLHKSFQPHLCSGSGNPRDSRVAWFLSAGSFTKAAFNKLYTFHRAISMSHATWRFQFAQQDSTPTNLHLRDGGENNAENRRSTVSLGDECSLALEDRRFSPD